MDRLQQLLDRADALGVDMTEHTTRIRQVSSALSTMSVLLKLHPVFVVVKGPSVCLWCLAGFVGLQQVKRYCVCRRHWSATMVTCTDCKQLVSTMHSLRFVLQCHL